MRQSHYRASRPRGMSGHVPLEIRGRKDVVAKWCLEDNDGALYDGDCVMYLYEGEGYRYHS